MNPERPLPPERRYPERRPGVPTAHQADLTDVPPEERRVLEQVWDLLDTAAPAPPAEATEQAWATLATRLHLDTAPVPEPPPSAKPARQRAASRRPVRRPRRTRRRWPALALSVAALIALVMAWPRTVVYTAPLGEQQTVSLPDGSTVHLNSGAQLAHSRGFARLPFIAAPTRTVRLHGEAFFDVASAASAGGRAFVVETFNAHVEVVGTQFNVQAWPSDEASQTTVTVEEGTVLVGHRATGSASTIRLEAGSEAVVSVTSTAPIVHTEGAPVEQATAWRRDGLAFRGVPLTAVVDELERRYAVQIRLDASVDATAPFYYYQPSPGALSNVLDDLGRGRGFQYRATSEGYFLFSE